MVVLSTLKSQRKRVAIATVEVAAVVDLVAVATAVAEEDEMTVLEILDQDLTVEDAEATAILLEDLRRRSSDFKPSGGGDFSRARKSRRK